MYEAKAANKNCIRFSAAVGQPPKISDEVNPTTGIVETSDEKPFS
jgi:hypothetical protein